jgi:hypothetical protein
MFIAARSICVVIGVVGLAGSALAGDMTAVDIKAFAIGKTVYLETTASSVTGTAGQGVLHWAEDGTAIDANWGHVDGHMANERRSVVHRMEAEAIYSVRTLGQDW